MSIKKMSRRVGAVAASLAIAVVSVGIIVGGCDNEGDDNPGNGGGNPNVTYGSLTDARDGQKYRTVKIGNQTWMAENLNYTTPVSTTDSSWCYDTEHCGKYGRLYNWNAAISVCPDGWSLPTRAKWHDLIQAAGGDGAGTKLKSKTGWNGGGNGTDDFGFSALPGGGYRSTDGSFSNAGNAGYWWSRTESGSGGVYSMYMYYYGKSVYEGSDNKRNGLSVRCVQ